MKLHLGGHWQNYPNGFIGLNEYECDITKPLPYQDSCIETIVLEHTNEHISLIENISFFKEVLRVLKEDGILRICMPCVDKLIQFKNDELGQRYCEFQTAHYYQNEDNALKEIGLSGVSEEPIAFMLDSLFKGHNHKFLWTSNLIKKVLYKIGFSEVYICEPGETHFNKEDCLERIVRGIHPKVALEMSITNYDPESMVIEAKK